MSDKKMLISRITASEHAYLRKLHDAGILKFEDIKRVIDEVVVDRFKLARELFRCAGQMAQTTDGLRRRIISTCYYSQYHACRAIILNHRARFSCTEASFAF